MIPAIIYCSMVMGRCFMLSDHAIPANSPFAACEYGTQHVEKVAADLVSRGKLPKDLFIYQRMCIPETDA
jgi:hypothetical protein